MHKISICTVLMNRSSHLQQTLAVNLAENINYPDLEYVVLDYNSTDGLEDYMKENMRPYLEKGILKYYRTNDPEYWDVSHAKNMLSWLATGDVLCMLDADNFAGVDYAYWVDAAFRRYGKKAIVTTIPRGDVLYRDQGGKLGIHRDCYHAVRGFDEAFKGYGIDDVDLTFRLEDRGGVRVLIDKPHYLKCIHHSHTARILNSYLMKRLKSVYLLTTPGEYGRDSMELINDQPKHHVLYLLKDGTFLEHVYEFEEDKEEDMLMLFFGWKLNESDVRKGHYQLTAGGLLLVDETGVPAFWTRQWGDAFVGPATAPPQVWKHVTLKEEAAFPMLVMAYSECLNRIKFRQNKENPANVNADGYGLGTVYYNFDATNPIPCGPSAASLRPQLVIGGR